MKKSIIQIQTQLGYFFSLQTGVYFSYITIHIHKGYELADDIKLSPTSEDGQSYPNQQKSISNL